MAGFYVADAGFARLDAFYEIPVVIAGGVELDGHAIERDRFPLRGRDFKAAAVDTDLAFLTDEECTSVGVGVF